VSHGVFDIVNGNYAANPRDFTFSGKTYGSNSDEKLSAPGTKDVGSISLLPLDNVKLYPGSKLYLYNEIRDAPLYRPYVLFSVMLCPHVLLHGDVLSIVTAVAEESLVVNIYRDFNLSTHATLETLSETFPDKTLDPLVVVPKSLKIRTTLKQSARQAVKTVPHLLTLRRTILNTLMNKCITSLRSQPGLLGPKFPLVMALASLVREEIHQYYRHLGKIIIRKDCKSMYVYDDYVSTLTNGVLSDVGHLLANSIRLSNLGTLSMFCVCVCVSVSV